MVKPISPDEIQIEKSFPDFVIIAFNEQISKNYRNGTSIFSQKDIVEEIIEQSGDTGNPVNSQEIFNKDWLSIEEVYQKQGWEVEYYKPSYNERGIAKFTFSRKK